MKCLSPTSLHLIERFAHEGARAFFRPKFSEDLKIPRYKDILNHQDELKELTQRPNVYFYVGLAIELLSAVGVFVFLFAASLAGRHILDWIVQSYANPRKWAAVIDLFAAGSLAGILVLLAIFLLKILRAWTNRMQHIIDGDSEED